MNTTAQALVAALFLSVSITQSANALELDIPFVNIGEHIVRVQKLPKTEEYTIDIGKKKPVHADVGIYHKQISVFWIPLINYGEKKYILYHSGWFSTKYIPINESVVAIINQNVGCNLPQEPKLPFWHRWGGKLFVLVLIAAVFLSAILSEPIAKIWNRIRARIKERGTNKTAATSA